MAKKTSKSCKFGKFVVTLQPINKLNPNTYETNLLPVGVLEQSLTDNGIKNAIIVANKNNANP